jgi:hypothetical protein
VSPDLPRRIAIVNTSIWLRPEIAIRLIQNKNAIEIFEDGEFRGIQLGNFGPINKEWSPLPPAELPGIHFEDPNPDRKWAKFRWRNAA